MYSIVIKFHFLDYASQAILFSNAHAIRPLLLQYEYYTAVKHYILFA